MSETATTPAKPHRGAQPKPDLRVRLAGIPLTNPVIAASGTFGYGIEFEDIVSLEKLGGFVVKGLSREPMAGNPPPRLFETAAGMLNSIGLQNIGAEEFVNEKLPHLRKIKGPAVIANVFGYTREDYRDVITILNEGEGIAAYELNVSCPNTKAGGIVFGTDPMMLEEVVSTVKPRLPTPADREALAQRDQHREDGESRGKCWRRRYFAGEHLRRHGHRSRDSPSAHCHHHWRTFRACDQADRAAHGLRSRTRREYSCDRYGRNQHGNRYRRVHARRSCCHPGGNFELLGSVCDGEVSSRIGELGI